MTEAAGIERERRWSARVHREVQAWLHTPGARPFRATTRDISLGGAFLVGPELAHNGDKVVVSLSIGDDGDRADYRMPAMVARVTDEGVGLNFECFDRDTIGSLRDVLYRAASGPGASSPHPTSGPE